MTTSTPRITVTENYVDITVAQPSLSGADVVIQNLDDDMTDALTP